MQKDLMSPGQDGLRAMNKDGSIVYGVSFADVVRCSKYKGFDDEGEGRDAARHLVLTKAMSLDLDSRLSHGGLESSAGHGGEEFLPPPSNTSSFDGDGIEMSSTADAAENNTDLSSRGFRDDTMLAALDAPTPSILILDLLLV